jgi:large subunit ribosomal protein L3
MTRYVSMFCTQFCTHITYEHIVFVSYEIIMKFIIGKKIEMTQLFDADGTVKPVTVIEAGPCHITEVKRPDTHGYGAFQIGFGKAKNINKPQKGHCGDIETNRFLKEFHIEDANIAKKGDVITVDTFVSGDIVKVTGITKGKGFQGVVKRHGFAGHPVTHGHKDQIRMPGSSGAQAPQRVFPGVRKPGRMGGNQNTVTNLTIEKIDPEKNLLYLLGAVPGHIGGIVYIEGNGDLKVSEKLSKTAGSDIDNDSAKDNNTARAAEDNSALVSDANVSETPSSEEVVSTDASIPETVEAVVTSENSKEEEIQKNDEEKTTELAENTEETDSKKQE